MSVALYNGVPTARSLAAVLRDSFTTDDDACRLVVATTGSPFTEGTADYYTYTRVVINGQTIKVPILTGSGLEGLPSGRPIYLLATRTILLGLGQVAASA